MKVNKPIYMDYMATTPIDSRVVEQMLKFMGPEAVFGNPASVTHSYGLEALKAVELARQQVATTIAATPESIVFTSGATEAINLALLGAARLYQTKGRHLITMSTEHKAVLDSCHALRREGFDITVLDPLPNGLLDQDALINAIREDTILVSIMHVNNEIGVVQDIAAIGEQLRGKGILFHVDAAQSIGKVSIDLSQWNIDLMSLSAHKAYGPKGVGALYIRQKPRIRLLPLTYGGGHEGGLRSGTLPTHQIVGMGDAFSIAEACRVDEQQRILALRERLWSGICALPGIQLNGHSTQRVANNLNVSFSGIDGSNLLPALGALAVSATSACVSSRGQASYVLQALGLSPMLAASSVRISLGRYTTMQEVEQAIEVINKAVLALRAGQA